MKSIHRVIIRKQKKTGEKTSDEGKCHPEHPTMTEEKVVAEKHFGYCIVLERINTLVILTNTEI
jgi:hypothetical protein